MADYQRYFVPGGTVFLTVVTYARRPFLTTRHARAFLREAIADVKQRYPFSLVANVLLPDHWHLIMQLPEEDYRYSIRIKQIKTRFTERWLDAGFDESSVTASQQRRSERGIWQPRFWEHTVTDADDLERCADYIHWNPRKHEIVDRVRDWKWSSFHRFVKSGQYDINWGGTAPAGINDDDWGEPNSAE